MRTLLYMFALLALGCGDDEPAGPDETAPDAAVDAPVAPRSIEIPFAAEVKGAPFSCSASYPGVGTPAATYEPVDFRFFVHDVRLVAGGVEVPVALTSDGVWQSDRVALLDFEDATGGCQMGTAGTNRRLVGTVPGELELADVTAIRFRVGVPMDLNHLDLTTSAPPLNEMGMSWGWLLGYRHLKIDGATTVGGEVRGFPLHVGSTGCPGDNFEGPPTAPCTYPNLPEIELRGFDPRTQTIVADIADVLVAVDITQNTAQTAPGCMSFPGDRECDAIFPRLGLPFEGVAPGAQALFRAR